MATAYVHRFLFLATVAALLALSATPAMATLRPLKGAAIGTAAAGTAAAAAAGGAAAVGGLAAGKAAAGGLAAGTAAAGGLAAGAAAAGGLAAGKVAAGGLAAGTAAAGGLAAGAAAAGGLAAGKAAAGGLAAGTAAAGGLAAGKAAAVGLAAGGAAAGGLAAGRLAAGAGTVGAAHLHQATAAATGAAAAATHPHPVTKQPPSILVKNICQSCKGRGTVIDDKICLDILSTVEANAAKDLKGLISVVLKLAGSAATTTQAAIAAFLQSPQGKQMPSLKVCQQKLDQVVHSFTKTLPEEMNGDVKTANTNIKTIATDCEECNHAITETKVAAPAVTDGIKTLTQFSVIGVEITNQMCNEQGKPSPSPKP